MTEGNNIGIKAEIKANFDAKGIEEGAKRAETALNNLRSNVEQLQKTFEALNATPRIFEQYRQEYKLKHGGRMPSQAYMFSQKAEASEMVRLTHNFEQLANEINQMVRENPELESTEYYKLYEKLAELSIPFFRSRSIDIQKEQQRPEISTERLKEIVFEKINRASTLNTEERKKLYEEVLPFIKIYRSRLNSEIIENVRAHE